MKSLFSIFVIFISCQALGQANSSKSGQIIDENRINLVREYYENNQLKIKGQEKGKKEWLGCLG